MDTHVAEIADGVYRLSTFVPEVGPLGLTFNQFLVIGDEPLLFHTGPRRMFALVREAVASLMPVERLRYVGFSHVEAGPFVRSSYHAGEQAHAARTR